MNNVASDDVLALPSRAARIGMIAWPSFFAAGVASFVFFAIVDPLELAEITWPRLPISRELGYTIGFFMFWACTFASSAFTALLRDTSARRASARDGDDT